MIINGDEQSIPDSIKSINQLINHLGLSHFVIAVHNSEIIQSVNYDQAILDNNSEIELFNFVGGG